MEVRGGGHTWELEGSVVQNIPYCCVSSKPTNICDTFRHVHTAIMYITGQMVMNYKEKYEYYKNE